LAANTTSQAIDALDAEGLREFALMAPGRAPRATSLVSYDAKPSTWIVLDYTPQLQGYNNKWHKAAFC